MSIAVPDASLRGDHRSALGGPALEHPRLWLVVQRAHHARLIYPGGPDYRSLIVNYEVDGWAIEVELPTRDVAPGDLDEEVVTMEILDDYLAMTVEQVHLIGRVQHWDRGAPGARCALSGPGGPGPGYTIAVRLLALQSETDERR